MAPARSWARPARISAISSWRIKYGLLDSAARDRNLLDGSETARGSCVPLNRASRSTRDSLPASRPPRRSRWSPVTRRKKASARPRSATVCATGSSPASATGDARFRSSIASANAVSSRCRRTSFPCCCRISQITCRSGIFPRRLTAGQCARVRQHHPARDARSRRAREPISHATDFYRLLVMVLPALRVAA